jgi:methyltransferase (TIGR00027 family)
MGEECQADHDLPEGVGLTALIIAQARAMESGRPDRLIDDPLASAFVAAAGPAFAAEAQKNADLLRLRGDFIAVRTRFFDEYLGAACQAGCRQVVLLAAGLDARAFRLAWPGGVDLFELDLSGVLAFKERVLATHAAAPACRRVAVPADLRADWPGALLAAGFLPGKPTAWLLEGILMYLSEDDRDRLLARVGVLSARGSQLALDQRGVLPYQPTEAGKDTDAQAARLGVRIPGAQADASLVDAVSWLDRHGWRARLYHAGECFQFYGRSVAPAVAEAAAPLWLARAERTSP